MFDLKIIQGSISAQDVKTDFLRIATPPHTMALLSKYYKLIY